MCHLVRNVGIGGDCIFVDREYIRNLYPPLNFARNQTLLYI
jgi:hypothetical protein